MRKLRCANEAVDDAVDIFGEIEHDVKIHMEKHATSVVANREKLRELSHEFGLKSRKVHVETHARNFLMVPCLTVYCHLHENPDRKNIV